MRTVWMICIILLAGCANDGPSNDAGDSELAADKTPQPKAPEATPRVAACLEPGVLGNQMAPPWPASVGTPEEIAARFDAHPDITVIWGDYRESTGFATYALQGQNWNPRLELWYSYGQETELDGQPSDIEYTGPWLLGGRTLQELVAELGFDAPNLVYEENAAGNILFPQIVDGKKLILSGGMHPADSGKAGDAQTSYLSFNRLYDLQSPRIEITNDAAIAAADAFMACLMLDQPDEVYDGDYWMAYQDNLVLMLSYQYDGCEPDSAWEVYVDSVSGQVVGAEPSGGCGSFL